MLSRLAGDEALQHTANMLADGTRAILEGGADAVRQWRAEALVLDSITTGFNLVAMRLGLPFVQVSNALYFDLSGHTPPPVYDWPHQTTPEAYARNRKGIAAFRQIWAPIIQSAREYSERWALGIDWEHPHAGCSPLGHLSQVPEEFDFPNDFLPPNFHYCGPFHDESDRPAVEFPWNQLTGEAIVYVSMGTLQNGLESIFRTILDGTGAPGRQLILSLGNNISPDQIGAVPENTIVVKKAPQIEILRRASLCITHGGLNTVLESLAQGVPTLAIPITNDQPGVAARIAHAQTGGFIPLKEVTPERLRATVTSLLEKPEYRQNARRFRENIARMNSLGHAADLIEEAFSAGPARRSRHSPA